RASRHHDWAGFLIALTPRPFEFAFVPWDADARIERADTASTMNSQVHYLPLTPGLFSILVILFAGLIILIQLRILRYAYMRLGVGPGIAMVLLFGSLIGS